MSWGDQLGRLEPRRDVLLPCIICCWLTVVSPSVMRRLCTWNIRSSGSLLWMMRWNLSWRTKYEIWLNCQKASESCITSGFTGWRRRMMAPRGTKARMVVKGFQQREGIDFNEIFSHVVKLTTIGSAWALWQQRIYIWNSWMLKFAFLHGDLEDIYMM